MTGLAGSRSGLVLAESALDFPGLPVLCTLSDRGFAGNPRFHSRVAMPGGILTATPLLPELLLHGCTAPPRIIPACQKETRGGGGCAVRECSHIKRVMLTGTLMRAGSAAAIPRCLRWTFSESRHLTRDIHPLEQKPCPPIRASWLVARSATLTRCFASSCWPSGRRGWGKVPRRPGRNTPLAVQWYTHYE
jgi:hypothetical protein